MTLSWNAIGWVFNSGTGRPVWGALINKQVIPAANLYSMGST